MSDCGSFISESDCIIEKLSESEINTEYSLQSESSLKSCQTPSSKRSVTLARYRSKPKKKLLNVNQFVRSQCSVNTQDFIEDDDYEEEEMNTSDRNFVTQSSSKYDNDISLYRLVDMEREKPSEYLSRLREKYSKPGATTSSEEFNVSYSST